MGYGTLQVCLGLRGHEVYDVFTATIFGGSSTGDHWRGSRITPCCSVLVASVPAQGGDHTPSPWTILELRTDQRAHVLYGWLYGWGS